MKIRIGSKKIRKKGNGNAFQNLMKSVADLFGKKIQIFFLTKLTLCLHKKGLKSSNNYKKLFVVKKWLVTPETSPCVTPGQIGKDLKLG